MGNVVEKVQRTVVGETLSTGCRQNLCSQDVSGNRTFISLGLEAEFVSGYKF